MRKLVVVFMMILMGTSSAFADENSRTMEILVEPNVQPLRGGLMPINEKKHSGLLCFLVAGRRIELRTS